MPVPIDEVRRTIRCHFLGVTQVPRATGIEILNEAVDRLVSQVRPERWLLADVVTLLIFLFSFHPNS
jgi:amyloid beta (A4) precursor protein-binding family B protein 2 (Fe65-like)